MFLPTVHNIQMTGIPHAVRYCKKSSKLSDLTTAKQLPPSIHTTPAAIPL